MRLTAVLAVAAFTAPAFAVVVPFTETFSTGNANWRMADQTTPLAWSSSGALDGSAYASSAFGFAGTSANAFVNVIRAHQSYGASGGAFTGDWTAAGVTGVSFQVRHDAAVPLSFFMRVSAVPTGPGPGAAAAIVAFAPVQPNTWTTITLPTTPGAPNLFLEGVSYNQVFSNIQNVQIGLTVPAALAGQNVTVNVDIDNVSVVPAPASLALLGLGALAARRRR